MSFAKLPHTHDSNIMEEVVKQATKEKIKSSIDKKPREVNKELSKEVKEYTGGLGSDYLPLLASSSLLSTSCCQTRRRGHI